MYTIVLRKCKIELELSTEDKYFVERQLDLFIQQAKKKQSLNSAVNEQIQHETQHSIEQEAIINNEPHFEEQIQPAMFEHVSQAESQSMLVNKEDVVPQSLDIGTVRPMTINSLQNPKPEEEPNFDKILNTELNSQTADAPIDKDENFIQYVESKSALDKLDFLVVTAQYLAHNENMNTFNLKHINAKLMQNFTLIVDHSILQSAISKELITQVHQASDEISSEYMLTEKGLRSY